MAGIECWILGGIDFLATSSSKMKSIRWEFFLLWTTDSRRESVYLEGLRTKKGGWMEMKNLRLSYTLLHIKLNWVLSPYSLIKEHIFALRKELSPATVHTLLLLIILFFSICGCQPLWDYLSPAVVSQLAREWQPVALSAVLLHSRSVRKREPGVRVRTKAEPCQAKGMRLTEGYLEIALWPKYGSSNQSNSVRKLWPSLSDVSLRQDNLILTCHILYN